MNRKKPVVIVSNGYADGPSQALRDYLIKEKTDLVLIVHPLVPESNLGHIAEKFVGGKSIRTKTRRMPHKPPLTYLFDFFYPLIPEKCSLWVGFNNLAALKGLFLKKIGRADKVVYWAVDFVPNRFGLGLATKIYDAVDKYVCKKVDLRVDLSGAALRGRSAHHKLSSLTASPSMVVPMGAWLDRTPKTDAGSWNKHKVVFLGHHVERQGVDTLIAALNILINDRKVNAKLELVGGGPLLEELKKCSKDLGLEKHVKFNGFVNDHHDVEKILASGTIAAAPYKKDPNSFTQFADPGKLKAYLGASLPIVLTDVPPNAKELEEKGVATLVEDNPESLALGLEKLLTDKKAWDKSRIAAEELAKTFDWNVLISKFLKRIN